MSAAIVSLVFSSCRARFYTPNRNPVPLYKNAGDAYFDFSTNLLNKLDITAGFAPVKSVGTYIGYARAHESNSSDSNNTTYQTGRYDGEMLNLGLGYFLNQETSQHFRFEIYGDLGIGSFKNVVTGNRSAHFNGNYTRIGIMPNFGYSSSDNAFQFAYSIRYSTIQFKNASIKDSAYWSSDITRYNSRGSYGMFEQALVFRAGSESVKFQLQLASYHGINTDEILNAIPRWNASVMFGIVITPNFYRGF